MPELTTTAVYIPGEGVLVTITGDEGLSVLVTDQMSIAAIQNHVAELQEWLA